MNEAMPRWRTFSSSGPTHPPDGTDRVEAAAAVQSPSRASLPMMLAVLGGAAAGAALVVVAAMMLGFAPTAGPVDPGGAPTAGLGGIDALTPLDDGHLEDAVGSFGAPDASAAGAEIVVDVGGAVNHPGLHRLRIGDRVGDAVEAAGGFAPRADLTEADRSLNLAQPLSDGVKVLVPELGIDGPRQAAADDGRIDLNTADQAALESLPGIGPVTAGKIIEARSQQRFASIADLRARGVVGEAVFEVIKDLVRASG